MSTSQTMRSYLSRLRRILAQNFSQEELKVLCFDLGVDYDDLPGERKTNKAMELVAYLEPENRIPELVKACKESRPGIDWPPIPQGDQDSTENSAGEAARPSARSRLLWVWATAGALVLILLVGLGTKSALKLRRGMETPTLALTEPPTAIATLTPATVPSLTATLTGASPRSPTPSPTTTDTSTPAPKATATETPTPTGTATSTPTETPTPTPTYTATATATLVPTHTPTPTVHWLSAPTLTAPIDGASFGGWNAEVILQWSELPGVREDEYYVVRIPYDDAGGVAEFWRKETAFRVPAHFSGKDVGFPDRHYNWTVQVMRCVKDCDKIRDDNAKKQGVAVGSASRGGLFYWTPDIGGPGPATPPPVTRNAS